MIITFSASGQIKYTMSHENSTRTHHPVSKKKPRTCSILLDHSSITPQALTGLTLLVAESAPHYKAKIIGLIILPLNRPQ
jgi:hypothetical protein